MQHVLGQSRFARSVLLIELHWDSSIREVSTGEENSIRQYRTSHTSAGIAAYAVSVPDIA
eukprot:756820-Rhodomonas_salina.1